MYIVCSVGTTLLSPSLSLSVLTCAAPRPQGGKNLGCRRRPSASLLLHVLSPPLLVVLLLLLPPLLLPLLFKPGLDDGGGELVHLFLGNAPLAFPPLAAFTPFATPPAALPAFPAFPARVPLL